MKKNIISPKENNMTSQLNSLPTSTKNTKNKKKWINSNINKRVCKRYVEKIRGLAVCHCGYNKDVHVETGSRTGVFSSRPSHDLAKDAAGDAWTGVKDVWNVEKDTHSAPTDAYGKLEFSGTGQKISDFVRADHLTSEDTMYRLLIDHWKLELPNLLISVTGGAQNFTMKRKLKEVFNKGMIKAALSTDAWIITGGSDAGVMKYVGEAVGNHLKAQGRGSRVVALGIATWGTVMGKQNLINEKGCWPVGYIDEPIGTEKYQSPLEPNHSHFILVDDGTQYQYGKEIAFRSRLESYIAKNVENHEPISTVSVVLEGGPGTIRTVWGSIMADIPAVIVEGSGRAADIIAYAYFNTQANADNTSVWQEVRSMIADQFMNDVEELLDMCKECIERRDHMTVFRLDDDTNKDNEIDVAILQALMKASNKTDTHIGKALENQMKLAITWNRIDVAKNVISATEDKDIEDSILEHLMEYSILKNRVDFVKLFMDLHSRFDHFFTKSQIVKFYKLTPENTYLHKLLDQYIKINDILSISHMTIDDIDGFVNTHIWSNSLMDMENSMVYKNIERDSKDWLIQLFFWCIFQNKIKLATLFWEEGKEGIATALAAYKILQSIDKKNKDPELHEQLARHMDYFQSLAIGVLSLSYEEDEYRTQLLLTRRLSNFGNSTAIALAIEADNKMFISHAACQRLFTKIWNGDMVHDNNRVKIVISLVTWPFLVPLLIKFHKSSQENEYEGIDNLDFKGSSVSINKDCEGIAGNKDIKGKNDFMTCKEKMTSFLNAPVIIFTSNFIAYICLLVLFSIIMLTDFHQSTSKKEMLLIFWVFTFIIEELRQACTMRFSEYLDDMWNILDILIMAIFVLGVITRFIPVENCSSCLNYARIVLCLDLMLFFIRTLHIFSVHRQLGPKLVMIKHMMVDMSFFVVILFVFIIAYGVCLQAILYPNAELNISLIGRIFKKAYFQIYGELFLDELEGTLTCDAVLTSNSTDPLCPINTKFLPDVLLAIYILFTNVLMLNLVIAMFSYTFTKIQENTDQHWCFQRYFLIKEYHDRPPLAPPFIILWQLYAMIRIVMRWCGLPYSPESHSNFAINIAGDELIIWENMRADEYIRQSNIISRASMENRVKSTHDRVELISQRFDDLTESKGTLDTRPRSSSSNVEKRLHEMEKQITKMSTSIETIKNLLQHK